jgi:hypothetical protein
MAGHIRTIFLLAALVAAGLVLVIELGSPLLVKGKQVGREERLAVLAASSKEAALHLDSVVLPEEKSPPGKGIAYMALLDGQWVFVLALVGLAMVMPERVQGRVQGVATLVFAVLVVLASLLLAIGAFALILLMLGLLLATPFGTIAYIARWGFFDTSSAGVALAAVLFLKLAAAACLILAHQRFLQNTGLVLLTLTSLACSIVLSFLHGLPPAILVSITDMLGALVFAVVAIVWGVVFAIFGLIGTVRAVV